MLGGIATICPECSYRWTISPAVAISWPCPKCGGSRYSQAFTNLCACGHTYGEHKTFARTIPSCAAFGLSLDELHEAAELLAAEPQPAPPIGDCTLCSCQLFELKPPRLAPTEFLCAVHFASTRGAGGREVQATAMPDGTLQLCRGQRSVSLRAESAERVVVEARPASDAVPQTFTMGHDSVGAAVIAVRQALHANRTQEP
jgi:hypothetical protein